MEPNGHQQPRQKEIVQENGGPSSLYIEDELDPWTAWAYKPRTITLLLIGACFLIWASGALDPEGSASDDIVTSVKRHRTVDDSGFTLLYPFLSHAFSCQLVEGLVCFLCTGVYGQ
uniref:Uncharacterized protein n=1 Tax=Opuntia streptacantha TaxID=393608 RepID=A0A7C8YXZ1_OPUST